MFRTTVAACVAAGAMMVASASQAATLFDSGEPTQCCGGPAVDQGQWIGGRLVFGSAATITGLEYFLSVSTPGPLRFSVREEGPGQLPGNILHSVSFDVAAGPGQWISTGLLDWSLAAGPAWFTIETDGATIGTLLQGVANPLARQAFTRDGGWNAGGVTPYGFRVYGEGGDPSIGAPWAQSIPEPTTWALMIIGFGGAGAALRRRRAVLA